MEDSVGEEGVEGYVAFVGQGSSGSGLRGDVGFDGAGDLRGGVELGFGGHEG